RAAAAVPGRYAVRLPLGVDLSAAERGLPGAREPGRAGEPGQSALDGRGCPGRLRRRPAALARPTPERPGGGGADGDLVPVAGDVDEFLRHARAPGAEHGVAMAVPARRRGGPRGGAGRGLYRLRSASGDLPPAVRRAVPAPALAGRAAAAGRRLHRRLRPYRTVLDFMVADRLRSG